jgi:(p)ppGpp synthase/HD superfamily hydrolase
MTAIAIDPALSPRYSDALQFCFEIHARQRRKGGSVPYVSHLLAVSALVMEQGGSEDEAIGALLHDS